MQLSLCTFVVGALVVTAPLASGAQTMGRPVAVVLGSPILEDDLDQWWEREDAAEYYRIRREAYEGRRRALDSLLAERLLASEARRRDISVATLLQNEVGRRARPVTETSVAEFLTTNPVPPGTSPAVVTPIVEAMLKQRAQDVAREEFLRALRASDLGTVQVMLEPPRTALTAAPHNPVRGRPGAPVDVVVFSDFECPFCRRTEPVLNRLAERFPVEVRFVWKHYPLSIHPNAAGAAEASQCAHDQGRFWAYHDALFADHAALDEGGLVEVARRFDLDRDLFVACLRSHAHAAEVKADAETGRRAGVAGTPTVFVNGVALVGALSFETYERAVLDELGRLRSGEHGSLATGANR